MANQITTKLDLDSSGFVSQIKKVRADIDAAEGATGKMKAGAKGLGDTLKNNAGPAALAAAGALAAFAAKGVKAFQDTALESGKFADATGVLRTGTAGAIGGAFTGAAGGKGLGLTASSGFRPVR